MSYDFTQILASKQKFRNDLAARDIVEKLQILDALHERALLLRGYASHSVHPQTVREDSPSYPRN